MILDTLALEFVDGEPILSPLQEQQHPTTVSSYMPGDSQLPVTP
ncbi:rCG49646, partial [Rattus norvegicus]